LAAKTAPPAVGRREVSRRRSYFALETGRENTMDLNYLFLRQQVERTRAEAASSTEARAAHEHLACRYEIQICEATEGRIRFGCDKSPEARPASDRR
jgi:hypothetical protein